MWSFDPSRTLYLLWCHVGLQCLAVRDRKVVEFVSPRLLITEARRSRTELPQSHSRLWLEAILFLKNLCSFHGKSFGRRNKRPAEFERPWTAGNPGREADGAGAAVSWPMKDRSFSATFLSLAPKVFRL